MAKRKGRAFHRSREHRAVLTRRDGKNAPWFLKAFGSRPASKLRRPLAEVA